MISRKHSITYRGGRGYPPVPLVVSLNSYSWQRRIVLDRLVSKPMWAKRGVQAGFVFAMFELLLAAVPQVDEYLCGIQFAVQLGVHVDDANQTFEDDDEQRTIEQAVVGTQSLVGRLKEKNLEVAAEKVTVIGTTMDLAKKVAAALGYGHEVANMEIRRLWVDHALAGGHRQEDSLAEKESGL